MKRYKLTLTALSCLLLSALTSCMSDGKEDFLDEYNTRLYFVKSGKQEVTLYKTGENTSYSVPIYKGGYDLKAEVKAKVVVLDQEQLTLYNRENDTDYELLPTNTYVLGETNIHFSSSEVSKTFDATFLTNDIAKLPAANYVLPLALNSNSDVNEAKNLTIIRPTIVIPSVYLAQNDFVDNILYYGTSDSEKLTLAMTMPIDNLWDFACGIIVDEELLEAYNQENAKNIQLLPNDAFSIEVKTFEVGSSIANIVITVDKTKLSLGRYALPLRMNECDNDNIVIDETKSTCIMGVNYCIPRTELREIPLTIGMLSSNATHVGDGSGLEGLLDGRGGGKHYHSNWAGEVIDEVYGHYIDFALDDEYTCFAFDFWSRFENSNGAPKVVKLYTSSNGTDWSLWETVEMELTAGDQEFDTDAMLSDVPFRYIRFSVTQSNAGNVCTGAFFNCGEMKIYGKK